MRPVRSRLEQRPECVWLCFLILIALILILHSNCALCSRWLRVFHYAACSISLLPMCYGHAQLHCCCTRMGSFAFNALSVLTENEPVKLVPN